MKNPKNQGRKAEELVEKALEILKNQNGIVVHYHYAQPSGEIDNQKIDFLIFLASRLCLPLQIKAGVQTGKAIRDHYKKCPYVLAIHIRVSHSPEKIAKQIEILIIRHLKNPFKDRTRREAVKTT